ncbi:hypothetical protein F5B22DRAFT_83364 [Xylaria bambusicola]|uniref:uncharacterized protein n=1 Tax=Xylaria bambusicola TaxID=326684 RepID=UPI0020086377|nr:uncharacterized protein F5B22DRAFT_83364 [Xylaria bambusicola]KAI0517909.1 hypothetical protein F5B22DRAFT_83364 [Xylaria bambusicola]
MMNRFRTKKKAKDEDGAPRPSQDSESSMPFRGFRKGKKSQENEKKEIDITAVLPSNDDFRTSLLMTGLSARFSMLREQDDPNTKIGKASDDSVLFPKRQSRMDLSSFRGLGDIAEVESVKAIPPFARKGSYNSDDADLLNEGSIMSRAKPTEGNNLFGGRQKIYKIPAGASSSKGVDGGMGGRALYDDDVAQSAFQKWRRAEKERELSQDEHNESDAQDEQRNSSSDLDPPRSESPIFSNYNRKRETSSTLSSTPSVARHSSAATSITSFQPTPSVKDWQPASGYSSGPERSVTRTRRLYETGFFNQDAQESGPGGLSRIDTMSRQRPFGTRTPELGQQSPSVGFANRLSGERKPLAKASAPNLRSISPPASASPTGPPNLGIRVPSTEGKPNHGGAPPISPPISETEENTLMSINPNDRGKATALGVFQKPAQPYDESRFAQRQLQLQRGRETPTQKARDSPNPPAPEQKSRSPSPVQQEIVDSPTAPVFTVTQSPKKDVPQPTSFLVDSDGSDTSSMMSPKPLPSPQIHLRRPSDREHPALRRDSGVPTPASSSLTTSQDEPSTNPDILNKLAVESKGPSPTDSPTLGPVSNDSGLSLMVRQHLRADSNASSIYSGVPPTAGTESRFPTDTVGSKATPEYSPGYNPWQGGDQSRDWNLDLDVAEPLADTESLMSDSSRAVQSRVELSSHNESNNQNTDEFASRLADGARRIREKLTSYVETDSRSSSPHRLEEHNDASDLAPLPRPSGLGAILRPRSSRGSLVDRGREPTSTRAFKMMGISPGGSRTASPGSESQKGQSDAGGLAQEGEDKESTSDSQPPGLRQFRQARRDLQRLKELESQSRHYPAPQGPPPDIPSPQQRAAKEAMEQRTRTPSRDHKPPPVYYKQRIPSDELWNGDSPDNSLYYRNDRQRSESESSYEARSNNRMTRSRDTFTGRETTPARFSQSPMRPTGLPGTDIKRSPIMPPQPHPNVSLRMNTSNQNSGGKLYVPRTYESDQPSPISPGASPLFNSAPPTPRNLSPRPPVAQNLSYDSVTVPSSGFHAAENNKSYINTRDAPPLPPINPRRRQDSTKARPALESFVSRDRDNFERNGRVMSPNHLSENTNGVDHRGVSTNGNRDGYSAHSKRPQRAMTDVAGSNVGFGKPRGNSSPLNSVPPTSRMTVGQLRNMPHNTGLPGGMI